MSCLIKKVVVLKLINHSMKYVSLYCPFLTIYLFLLFTIENIHFLMFLASFSAQLIIFYTIFYTVLAALFTICLQGLFITLNDEHPKWQLEDSLIGEFDVAYLCN